MGFLTGLSSNDNDGGGCGCEWCEDTDDNGDDFNRKKKNDNHIYNDKHDDMECIYIPYSWHVFINNTVI